MLKLFDDLLGDAAASPIDLTARRYGTVAACDGGLLEVSGLSVPVGALCRVAHGSGGRSLLAEVIGFRNGRTMAMLLGDTVMLRPGARVRPEGKPGMLPVGEAFLGRSVDGEGAPSMASARCIRAICGPPVACVPPRWTGRRCATPLIRGARAQRHHHLWRGTTHRHHGRIGRGQIGAARHDRAWRQCGDRHRRPDRRTRPRSVRFRRTPYERRQAHDHRRHRRPRRPCAQSAHSRRDAGHVHGRIFPRSGRRVLLIMDR
jgi:hypothetical protein